MFQAESTAMAERLGHRHRSPALCLVAQLVADSDNALYLAHGGGQPVLDLVGLRMARLTMPCQTVPVKACGVQGEVMRNQVKGRLMVGGLIGAGERAQDAVLADDADQAAARVDDRKGCNPVAAQKAHCLLHCRIGPDLRRAGDHQLAIGQCSHLAMFAAMPLARPQHPAHAGQGGPPGQQIRRRHKAHHPSRSPLYRRVNSIGTRPTGQGLASWTRPHAGQNRETNVTWAICSWIAARTDFRPWCPEADRPSMIV